MTDAPALPVTDTPPPRPIRHSPVEDAQGLLFGVLMVALSVTLMQHLGFVTGQTAGLALVISYASGWSFGAVFFALNLPFYALALARLGLRFTLKTFAAVSLLSLLAAWLPQVFRVADLAPLPGALLVGATGGAGLLALFRHGASLGGVGVLAVWLQDRTGFRAGWTQLCVDLAVFGLAFALLDPVKVAWSALGALVLNLVIAINHRRDHYVAY
ncbi:MAG: YitT family protein [Rhodobacteraceae bacterium]|nr:YitT family protein [Paracoccaceae bacterium]